MIKRKSILIICISLSLMVLISGCWERHADSIEGDLAARAELNQKVVDDLVAAELIAPDTGETLKKSISKALNENSSVSKSAITWYIKYKQNCWSSETTYDRKFLYNNSTSSDGVTISSNIIPMAAVGVNQVEALKKDLSYTVSILDTPNNNQVKALDEVDKLVKNIKGTTESSVKNQYFKELDKYFKDTQEPLLDPVKEPIIKDTVLSPMSSHHTCICGEEDCSGATITGPQIRNNTLGYDMILTYKSMPTVAVRFLEFNPEVVTKLIGAEGADKNKYLVDPIRKRVYLLEYPINYIKTIETDGENNFKSLIEKSELTINIYTGSIKNKNDVEIRQKLDQLIHIKGSGGMDEEGNSSFVIYDKNIIEGIGYQQKEIEGGAVVLRDYLEYTYMPGVNPNENIIALGRRIRVNNFTGNLIDNFASFIDKEGNLIIKNNDEDSKIVTHEILVTDLVDIESIGIDNTKKKISGKKSKIIEEDNEGINQEQDENSTETGYVTEDIKSNDLLKEVYVSSINPTYKFPSDKIATKDGEDLSKGQMIFYGILTDKNMFETALYSEWVNADDEDKGSLKWWNEWLTENEYVYRVDKNNIENTFLGNFEFIDHKDGVIVLNLDTISKIQKEINQKDQGNSITFIRTLFIILGFILMGYSALLIGAWGLDVLMITGIKFLEAISFGNWSAVNKEMEIPSREINGKYYIDFKGIIWRSVLITAIGIVLVRVDIIDLVFSAINALGGLGKIIDVIINRS